MLLKKQAGLTLVEVLVGTVVAAIAATLLISILVQNNGLFYTQTANIDQGVNLNDTSTEISEAIRNASNIEASYTYEATTYITDSDTLVLALPSYDSANNIIDSTYDHVVIFKDTQKAYLLKKMVFPNVLSSRKAEDKVLSNKLSLINFNYLDNNNSPTSPTTATKIEVIINLMVKNGVQEQTASSSSLINLRNN